MRVSRLNRWQWIGIVLSVIWFVVAFFIERRMVYDPIYTTYDHCVYKTLDWSICDTTMDSELVKARKAEPMTFAIVALVPILALWVFGYVGALIMRRTYANDLAKRR